MNKMKKNIKNLVSRTPAQKSVLRKLASKNYAADIAALVRSAQSSRGGRGKQRATRGFSALSIPRNVRQKRMTGPMNMVTSSDGLNQSMTMTNNSSIEEQFKIRFEKVTDLIGTTSSFALLTNGQYYLNPGNTVLFPIFSKIAVTYEQYRVNVLRFHYVTQSYTASGTNVGAGRIIMATDFDPDAANFVTKSQMENYEKSVAFEPYARHVVHDVLAAKSARKDLPLKSYFVSGSANQLSPVTGQAKFYDLGNFQVAGSGTVDATSIIGELWVEYSFTMIRPIQEVPLGDAILAAHYIVTPVTASSRFLSGVQQVGSNMSLTLAANTITIPIAGNFFVTYNASAATSFTDANNLSVGAGGTLLTVLCSVGVADNYTGTGSAGSGGTLAIWNFVVSCTVPGVVITFPGTPTIVGATKADIWCMQIPSDIITVFAKQKECDRIDRLEKMMRNLVLTNEDWSCHSYDKLKPEIPMRSIEPDQKSQSSQSRFFR
jgi:hypothetical protein